MNPCSSSGAAFPCISPAELTSRSVRVKQSLRRNSEFHLPRRRVAAPQLLKYTVRVAVSDNGPAMRGTSLTDSLTDGTTSLPSDRLPLSQPLKSYEVPLWEAFKFGGPAPHIINKRLAMLGFVWGAKMEFQTGQTLAEQAVNRPLLVVFVVGLTVWASLVPITKGAKSEAFGLFTPRAEIANGRAACLGFAILLLLEAKAKVPFF